MTHKRDDVIYMHTKEDVDDVAESLKIRKLTEEHYRQAQKFIERFCEDGAYTWWGAIADALRYVEEELQAPSQEESGSK